MMKPQCLGRDGEIALLVVIIQKPNEKLSTRVSVMNVTDCSEVKVTQVHLRETEACE